MSFQTNSTSRSDNMRSRLGWDRTECSGWVRKRLVRRIRAGIRRANKVYRAY